METIYSIKNKVVLVTGATGYLGKQMVKDLTKAGAKVVLLSRNIDKLNKVCDLFMLDHSQAFEIDVSNEQNVKSVIEKVNHMFGKIDVLVNNAYFGVARKFDEYTKNDWFTCLDGTIISIDVMTQAVSKYMIKQKHGRIVNIASMYGIVSPDSSIYKSDAEINPLAYGVGKAGVIQYTKYSAMMLAKYNINVNTVSYGPFPNLENVKDDEFLRKLSNKTFLKRVGVVDEITAAIFFLSIDENSFMTGQNIIIDGGWTSW